MKILTIMIQIVFRKRYETLKLIFHPFYKIRKQPTRSPINSFRWAILGHFWNFTVRRNGTGNEKYTGNTIRHGYRAILEWGEQRSRKVAHSVGLYYRRRNVINIRISTDLIVLWSYFETAEIKINFSNIPFQMGPVIHLETFLPPCRLGV